MVGSCSKVPAVENGLVFLIIEPAFKKKLLLAAIVGSWSHSLINLTCGFGYMTTKTLSMQIITLTDPIANADYQFYRLDLST